MIAGKPTDPHPFLESLTHVEIASNAPPEIAARLADARTALLELGTAPDVAAMSAEAGHAVGALTQDADLAIATALHWAQRDSAQHGGLAVKAEQLTRRFGPVPVRLAG